jgi:hypothetical protein
MSGYKRVIRGIPAVIQATSGRGRRIVESGKRAVVAHALAGVLFATFLIVGDGAIGLQVFLVVLPVLVLLAGLQIAAVTAVFAIGEPRAAHPRPVRITLAALVSVPLAAVVMSYLSSRVSVPPGYTIPTTANIIIGTLPALLAAVIYGLWLPPDSGPPRPFRLENALTAPAPRRRLTRPIRRKGGFGDRHDQ